jgi:glycosyltransferase involved in cell wall biosynthesis
VKRLASFRNPLRVGQRLVFWPYREVSTALEAFSPDILVVSDPAQLAIPGTGYARRKHIPSVYLIQQLPWFVASYLPGVRLLRQVVEKVLWTYGNWLIRRFSGAVTPTHIISNIVHEHTGIRPSVITSGVGLNLFQPATDRLDACLRAELGVPTESPIILHVGRLDIDKQVDEAIHACALAMRQTNAHLLIAGDGQAKARLVQLCEQLGIQARTHFTGFVSVAEGLPGIYRMARVFVTASRIETQGIVLLEAAASGIPIVATDATCISEVVVHNQNGFLCHPGDVQEMAYYLIQLVQSPSLAARMGKTGNRLVLKHSREYSLDLHEKLLLQCLARCKRLGETAFVATSLTD